jgi:HlyD family secretion protein
MKRKKKYWTYAGYGVFVVIAVALAVYWLSPMPVDVDVAPVIRMPLSVTVTDDGRTRIREKYVVSAAVSGRLARVDLHPGDEVKANETVLTYIDPAPPSLLDLRSQAEAKARLEAAKSQEERAKSNLASAEADMGNAQIDFDRVEPMVQKNAVSRSERDRAELRLLVAKNSYRSSQLLLRVAEFEVQQAQSALIHLQRDLAASTSDGENWRMKIVAPISGRVLRVFQESSAIVSPGTPLLELGDPTDLEVVVDVLSSDGVKVKPGQTVLLTGWGGEKALNGKVRCVEPSGFMKISAIGVEEQRVNVVIDFLDAPSERSTLGDDFRVDAQIVVDSAEDVLQIPHGASFRRGQADIVFVVEQGCAVERTIKLGRVSQAATEVIEGLTEGEQIILYPSDKIVAGVRVRSE